MSFYSPQTSSIDTENIEFKALNATDIEVVYRDTSGVNSSTQSVIADKVKLDLSTGYDEQILSGSVRFKIGSDTYIDRTGTLYRNVDPSNNSGVASGLVRYGTGDVELEVQPILDFSAKPAIVTLTLP